MHGSAEQLNLTCQGEVKISLCCAAFGWTASTSQGNVFIANVIVSAALSVVTFAQK